MKLKELSSICNVAIIETMNNVDTLNEKISSICPDTMEESWLLVLITNRITHIRRMADILKTYSLNDTDRNAVGSALKRYNCNIAHLLSHFDFEINIADVNKVSTLMAYEEKFYSTVSSVMRIIKKNAFETTPQSLRSVVYNNSRCSDAVSARMHELYTVCASEASTVGSDNTANLSECFYDAFFESADLWISCTVLGCLF